MATVSRPRAPRGIHFALAWLALSLPVTASAAWPPDPLTNVPLCVTPYSSRIGAAVSDGQGGAIAVWFEDRGGDFDVFARRVRFDGTPLWTSNGVPVCVTTPGTAQVLPEAVSDGAGGVIVGWLDGRAGPNALFLQRVDSTGARSWAEGGVIAASTASSQLSDFSLVADGAGGVVAAWATPQNGVSSDIFAQHLNASGTALWGANAKALCTDPGDQVNPVVTRTGAGNFVVAWEDGRLGFRTEIYGQSASGAGTLQWAANGRKLAGSADNAINPMLTPSVGSDCLLFWDADTLGVGEVRGLRLDATGAAVWAGAGLRMFPAGANGLLGVATDGLGGAYLSMARPDPASGNSVLWVQRAQGGGLLLFGAKGMRASSISSNQYQLSMAPDASGGLLMTWYDDVRGFSPQADIIAQRITPGGGTPWAQSGVPVCRAPNTGPGLFVAPDGAGGAVVAWSDTRNSPSPDIYAQGVDSIGELGTGLGVKPSPTAAPTALARPAPNPLPHGRASISYSLTATQRVQLRVVDPVGRVVGVLEDGVRDAGVHEVEWDGRANGQRLPPGLYLVQLLTPSRNEIRRLVLL